MSNDSFADKKNARTPENGSSGVKYPHNIGVERSVLSAMLKEPACIDIAIEHLGTRSEVFFSQAHRIIFNAVLDMHKQKNEHIDVVSLAYHLAKAKRLDEIGGEIFLAELYGEVATTVNLEGWCKILRDTFILRQMMNVCTDSLHRCENPEVPIHQLVDEIESDIYNIRNSESKTNIVEIKDSIRDEFATLQAMIEGDVEVGLSTGYTAIDDLTGGLKKGEMFVLAARPSIGKTAIALNIIRNMALDEHKPRRIAFFSLEMTAAQISRRFLCSEAKISETVFWNKTFDMNNITRLTNAVSKFSKAKIFIDPTAGISVAELRAKCRRLQKMHDIEVVVIDYLQLMKGDSRSDNRQQEVAEISSGLKQIAKDLNIPVLVLAQLNRDVDKSMPNASPLPKLNHLRESGAIEQDADIVAFLHRDRDKAKEVLNETQSVDALFIVEKNRNGRTGMISMNFFPAITRFEVASKYKDGDGPPPGTA
ncbi:MAG: replicative DNA helicase [Lentisphaeria bacterium]|nr:replicative DNA helicase [Lentisphaeria bacterium]